MDNITYINGKSSFAENRKGGTAWHKKGQQVQGLMTIKEALMAGGQDFRVAKVPVMVLGKETDWFATVRTDTSDTMGMVKEGYKVIQNDSAFDFFNPVVQNGDAIIETVGTLGKHGERTFMLAQLPESAYTLYGQDEHRAYVLLTNDHSGNGTFLALPTDVRVVCWNTMQMALHQAKRDQVAIAKVRHQGDVKAKMQEAYKVLNLARLVARRASEFNAKLIQTPLTRELASSLLDQLLNIKVEFGKDAEELNSKLKLNQKAVLGALLDTGIGADMFPNTAYNYLNAVTEYVDHLKTVRGGDNLSSMFVGGSGFKMKMDAENQMMKLTNFNLS